MSRLPLAQWDPSLFTELQQLLSLVATQPSTSLVRRLYQKLEVARPWILALSALPAPNNEDKEAIANSPVTNSDGVQVQVKDQLLATTNDIADTLNISHLLSAVLALHAVQERGRFPSRSPTEVATYILHEALQALLDFVRELLRLTVGPDAEVGEPFDELRIWVEDLLDEKGALGFLADVAVDQIDAIQVRLDALVRSPASGGQLDLINFRVAALRTEQNRLAGILGVLADSGLLKTSQVVKIVKWLKKCAKPDAVAAAVFAAFSAATQPLESIDPRDHRYDTIATYSRHAKFILVVSNVIFGEKFEVERLQEAVKLQWSLFYHSAVREEPSLAQSVGLSADNADRNVQDAISAGVLQFLSGLVESLDRQPEDPTTALASRSDPANNQFFYQQLELLITWLAAKRQFLRNLKNKEEDVGLRRSQTNPTTPPTNFQGFLTLTAVVYTRLPPDSAERLWDEPSFTSVALDNRSTFPGYAFWDMITAISTGPVCASKCYEKLKDTRLSWASLFKFYQHYTEIMPHLFETTKVSRQISLDPMPEDEYNALEGWTRLLATVVRGSALARGALLQAKPHPLQLLFDFVNCDIAIPLKAIVMDAITAFVERRGDTADDDVVARAVEFYERVSFADPTLEVREGSRVPAPIGWIQRMEFGEQDTGEYPLTRAYVKFLTALIPSSKPRVNNALRRGAVYVIDRVLLGTHRYVRDDEHWEVLDAAMGFFEKALLSFDLTDLLTPTRGTAAALADQPGFLVLLRLLSEPAIFTPLADVVDHATTVSQPRAKIISTCLLRVLRIYYRVLDIQLVFSDVLLLTLASTSGFRRPLGFQSLDHYLLNRLSNVTNIALLVGDDDLTTSFVSLKIIQALAQSPLFSSTDVFRGEYTKAMNRLAGVIDASDDSIRIAQGFCVRLESEGEDLSPEEVERQAKAVLRGDKANSLPIIVRSTILDLLVDGTADSTGPNIAHFLLGFDFRAREFGLQDPRSPTARLSCLGVVLDQLNSTPPVIQLHPVLAAKSAQLLHQLFVHPVTGPSTMAYAESYEAFPARQLATLPRVCPPATHETSGMGIAATRTDEVETSASVLVAYLEFEQYILSSVALQTFAYEGHGASSEFVAGQLFSDASEDEDQRPPLIIDLVSAVDIQFTETDAGEAAQNKVLEFYSGFSFDQFKRPDSDWYDLQLLSRALRSYRRQLERQGAVIPGTSAESMVAEANYILRRLAMKNRETEISIAKGSFLQAWLEALKVSLAMLFHTVSEDRQEILLFELLDEILNRLTADLAPGVLEILAEAVLVALTTLVSVLSVIDSSNLPVDRLSSTLAKIVDAVIRPGTTENARGNLYAAVSQYLQLVPEDKQSPLHRVTVTALGARKDRFVSVLCRDAMDMRDVWKTECYSLLASVVSLGDGSLVAPLTQGGYLVQIVRSVKDREMALQECLSPDHDHLHAYWVYESKLAFLIAYAATPKGADDLVEAGVFQTFATCGFIAVQPFSEDVVDDVSANETVERQHRVLVCALQLLVRILTSNTRSGVVHGISFLNAHKESLLVLLRENQAFITVPGIDETRLIIALLTLVVGQVNPEDLRSASGFGAFHLAVLSLAAKFFDKQWADATRVDAESARPKVLALNQVILTYLCATTVGLKAGHGQPVFVTGVARASGTKYIASAPSLPAAVELLADLAEAAQDVSNSYDDVADKIAAAEDISAFAAQFEVETVDELQAAFAGRMGTIYNMIESLLLLLWRHLLFYANDAGAGSDASGTVRPTTMSLSFSTAGAATAGPGAASLKSLERVAASLRGVLDRLDDVDATIGQGRKEDAYHAMLVRRLRELCAGLSGE
ncbi:hypothetical protein Q8F55_006347 [Vanrija albida]|uniref:Nucleoporin Nup186/Nup192/Nup205 n=1 Tax=Vanrija albida TaxID=181172 RepID=A0ABR3PWT9_9TREE